MIFDTRTIKNFLLEEEITEIEEMHSKGLTTLNVDTMVNETTQSSYRVANIWDFRIKN